MSYWVYILASKKNGVLYMGVTNNLLARVQQHREGKGSEFAKKYFSLRLVFAQEFADVNEALAAEKRLKKWRRAWRIELIERSNPEWRDLLQIADSRKFQDPVSAQQHFMLQRARDDTSA